MSASEGSLRMRVFRKGPYTKQNRRELRHHVAVGAGVGSSVGAAAGAHLGAAAHELDRPRALQRAERLSHRGKYALAGAGLVGAAGALYGADVGIVTSSVKRRQRALAKAAQHPGVDQAAATVIGGGLGQGAYQGAGYGTKHYVDRHTRKGNRGVTAEQVRTQDRALKPNKKAYGMHLPNGSPGRDNVGYHRAYPRELPQSGKIRALGYTHEGRLGVATGATLTALGAGGAALAAHHRLHKAEPLAIAGKLWRRPTMASEFRRAFSGTSRGEKVVGQAHVTPKRIGMRDRHGYPRIVNSGVSQGGDARAALKHAVAREARLSPHSTSFKAGAKAAGAAAVVGRHPEYGISVPAAAGGGLLIHHEATKGKKKKNVSKSAFGVAKFSLSTADKVELGIEGAFGAGVGVAAARKQKKQQKGAQMTKPAVAKAYVPGTITYHQQAADLHARKRRSGRNQATVGAAAAGGGVALHLNADRVADVKHSSWPNAATHARNFRKAGAGLAVAGGTLAAIGASRAIHHGRMQNRQSQLAQVGRRQRNAQIEETMAKSAFGVLDDRLEKNFLTEALETGVRGLKGVKSGLSGSVGAESSLAGSRGKLAGSAVRSNAGKLVSTKRRTAATAGVGGLGLGMSMKNKSS